MDTINDVLESSNKLLNHVNDILNLASLDTVHTPLQPNRVDVPTLLKEVTEQISQKEEASKNTFVLNLGKGVGEWVVDQKQLKNALYILLKNVTQSISAKGKIIIEARLTQQELEISIYVPGKN